MQTQEEDGMSNVKVPANLPPWIGEHLRRYVESDGAEGHMWDSTPVGGPGFLPTLLLTTIGRRSGQSVVMPLIYGEVDGRYVVVASKGGAPTHPGWYLNLVAQPAVEVQVGADRFRATARTATGEQRARLWQMMAAIYPPYKAYQAKTQREIPVVVLDRV
jgi:deazaflavin-dependent oxidoreductase (nitroreductase family)